MKKQVLSLLMALVFCLSLLPAAAFAAGGTLSGSGTAGDPYLIEDADDWATFVNGKYTYWPEMSDTKNCFKLTTDLTVDNVSLLVGQAGTDIVYFSHCFDGGGHTITLDISDAPEYCALFRCVGWGATIRNLTVDGTIVTQNKFASGLVSEAVSGDLTIENCRSDVVIESGVAGDGTHGGLIAVTNGGYPVVTIDKCVFHGQIRGTNTDSCGGFVGWLSSWTKITIRDSIYAPSGNAADDVSAGGSGTFFRYDTTAYSPADITLENAYYTRTLGDTPDDAAAVSATPPDAGLYGTAATIDAAAYYATASVSGIKESYAYTGSAISVEPVVTFGGQPLANGTDYTLSYSYGGATVDSVKEMGDYTVTVTGTGTDYHGASVIPFRVAETRTVSDWNALKAALAVVSTVPIRLGADITAAAGDEELLVAAGVTAVLDLNGFSIDANAAESALPNVLVVGDYSSEDGSSLTVTDTSADGTGTITGGGTGVYVMKGSSFILESGTISGNNTQYGQGAGVYNEGTFTMNGGEISGNTAAYGSGGIYSSGTFTMNGGEISGNSANGGSGGGGVLISSGSFILNDGVISSNASSKNGGGVYIGYTASFTMKNGTISGNTAAGSGGGVYCEKGSYLQSIQPYVFPGAEMIMSGGSVTGNTAGESGGGVYLAAGAETEEQYNAHFTVSASPRITGNNANNLTDNVFLARNSFNNLQGNPIDQICYITVDGALGSEAEIGVTTQKEPVVDDPAIFTGVLAEPADMKYFISDNEDYTVVLRSGKAALYYSGQSAWDDLKDQMAAGGDIRLTRNVAYGGNNSDNPTLVVPDGKTVTLDLNGYTVDRHLGQSGENAPALDQVIRVEAGGTLIITDSSAKKNGCVTGGSLGGIENHGTLTLQGGSVSGNGNYHSDRSSRLGGGVINLGVFSLEGGSVSGNNADTGGGGVYNSGTFNMTGGTLEANGTWNSGGGVYNAGIFTMTGGTISQNESNAYGGAVYSSGTFTMHGGQITGNSAWGYGGDHFGGGVFLADGRFDMSGGGIVGNTAGASSDGVPILGGGVYVADGTISVSGTARITGNRAVRSVGMNDETATSNVYLTSGKKIVVSDPITGVLVGVTTEDTPTPDEPVVFTNGLNGNGSAASFASDVAIYGVAPTVDGEAQLIAGTVIYSVTVAPCTHGTVTASVDQAVETALVTLTIEPEPGYGLQSLTVEDSNGVGIPVDNNTFSMPADDVTVTAVFARTYTVTVLPSSGGTVAASASEAAEGAEVTLTVTADDGYALDTLTVTDTTANKAVRVRNNRFTMPAGNVSVSATFRAVDYSITVEPTEGGAVTASAENANAGDKITLTVTPDPGYELESLTVTDTTADKAVSLSGCSFIMPKGNVKVTAVFRAIVYSIDVIDAENGTVTVSADQAVIGTEITLTVTPDEGYLQESLSVIDTTAGTLVAVSDGKFDMPAGNVVVTATFREDTAEPIARYAVTAASSDGGTVLPTADEAAEGETVIFTVTPDEGMETDSVTVSDSGGSEIDVTQLSETVYSFRMPAADVTISVTFRKAAPEPADLYAVRISMTGKGYVLADKKEAAVGDTVTFSAAANVGWLLHSAVVMVQSGGTVSCRKIADAAFSFEMPESDVTISVVFRYNYDDVTPSQPNPNPDKPTKRTEGPFIDVPASAWFFDAVYHCYDNKLLNGVSDELFDPSGTMTRAMFAVVLHRIAGKPAAAGGNPFSDVADGAWYTDAILWAVSEGILSGYGSGEFGTNDPVTREQILTILWRANGKPVSAADTGLSAFGDTGKISPWAVDAYAWALRTGILTGMDGGLHDPNGAATRAEVAQLLMNYMTGIDNA